MGAKAWVEEAELADLPALVSRLLPGNEVLPIARKDRFGSSFLLLLGKDYAVRVAHSQQAAAKIRHEIALLESLQGLLPFAVPIPDSRGENPVFYAYRQLNGKFLTLDDIAKADRERRLVWAECLAGCFTALHALPLDRLAVGEWNWARDTLKFMMRSSSRFDETKMGRRLKPLFYDVIADSLGRKTKPENKVFLHNDLRLDHLLWDTKAQCITGLLDFGQSWMGDFHWDLRFLRFFDREFQGLFMDAYARLTGRTIDNDLLWRLERFSMMVLLVLNIGDAESFAASGEILLRHAEGAPGSIAIK